METGHGFWKRVTEVQNGRPDSWLASEISVAKQTLSSWKTRGTVPDGYHCQIIADALGVDAKYLVTGIRAMSDSELAEASPLYGWTKVADDKTLAWVSRNSALIVDLMVLGSEQLAMVATMVKPLAEAVRNSSKASAG